MTFSTSSFLRNIFITTLLLITSIAAFAQGSESFSNLGSFSSYANRVWTGDDGFTWTAEDARSDQNVNGRAVTIRNGSLIAGTTPLPANFHLIPGGIGDLTMRTQLKFSGSSGNFIVWVNGTNVGTIPYSSTATTTTISGINISGSFTLEIEQAGSSSNRVAVDDLSWTGFAGSTPCTTPSAPTALNFSNVTINSLDGDFTASAGGADGYIVVRKTTAGAPSPVDGNSYSVGAGLGGDIIYDGTSTSFSDNSLGSGVTYYYYVFAYNNAGCTGGPVYSSVLAGSQATATPTTAVQFTSSSASVTEGTPSVTLTLSILFPSGSNATSATVTLGSGNGRVNGFTSQTVTWAAGDNANKTITLLVTDNSNCEGTDNLTFNISSVTGGTSAAVGATGSFDLEVLDNDASNTSVISNDFETGNLTGWSNTGDWTASSSSPINGSNSLKHNLSGIAGSSYIYGDYPGGFDVANGDVTWRLVLKNGNWDPSSSNYFWYVLMSDQLNFIASPSMNGYAVGINMNGSSDALELYRITGGAGNATTILSSSFDWNNNNEVAIEVTRNIAGEWELKFNDTGNFAALTSAGTTTDNTFTTATYHGLGFSYTSSRAGLLWLDDLDISQYSCAAPVPTIVTSTSGPLSFGNVTVGGNATQTYTVEGTDLTDPIVITAPTGYQVSTDGTNFFNSLNLTPSSGTVSTTTITVRFSPVANVTYNGDITHTSTGATQVDVAVTGAGTVPCTAPLNQATSLNLSPAATGISGTFTAAAGGADGYLVVVSTASNLGATPNNTTTYTAGQSLGSGTVVSSSASTNFTATGLSTTTQYYLHVFAYNNVACTGGPLYKTPALVNNATTLASPFASFDNFDRADNSTVGIPSSGGSTAWSEVEANTGLAEIYNNRLDINNTSPQGKAYVVFDMTGKFSTTYDRATSELEWYFNMAQTRPDPSGFGTSNYGIAMILGATASDYSTSGDGYAVVLGESGSNDRVKLVKFTGGLTSGTMTDLVADGPNTNGINGDNMFDIHVKYNPVSHLWSLYVHDGGYDPNLTFNFADPTTVTYGSGASIVDQTYTGTDLPFSGGLWSYATSSGEFASFDNFYIPTAQACNNSVWTGAVSTDWFEAGNWSCNEVPTTTTTVTIPNVSGASGNFPEVAAVNGFTAYTGDLIINAGASINVLGVNNVNLEVYGDLTNNGVASVGNGKVILKGAATQTITGTFNFTNLDIDNASGVVLGTGTKTVFGTLSLVNGTLTTNNRLTIGSNATRTGLVDEFSPGYTGTITGNITVQRYANNTASSFFYVGAPVGGASVNNWTGVSLATQNGATNGSQVIPTSTCSITELAVGSPYGRLFDYRENQVNTCNLEGWHVRTSGAIGNAQGFAAIVSPGTIIGLNGSFVTGPVTSVNLTYTANSAPAPGSGFNLVANPYAAPIDWVSVATANSGSINGTAYMYQTSGGLAGTYNPVNQVSGGGQIGTSQSFFVEATGNNVTMSFDNSMKRNGTNNTLRSTTVYDNKLVANVSGNGFADRAIIAFGRNFTTGYDAQFDARKLMSKIGQPSLYVNNGMKLAINAEPSTAQTQMIPLHMVAGADGSFVLDFDMSEFDPTAMIYLEDLKNGTMQNLWTNNSYSFAANAADDADRFVLHFYPALQVSTNDQTCAGNDGALALIQLGDTEWDYSLVDANGIVVDANTQLNGTHVAANLAAGTYQIILNHSSGHTVTRNVTITGADAVAADFESLLTAEVGEIVNFSNITAGATTYTWDFGDGNTSTAFAPAHVYAQAGTYTVTLTASNGVCTDVFTTSLKVNDIVNSITDITEGEIKVYAFNNILYVSFNTELSGAAALDMYDLTGRKVSETQQLTPSGTYQLPLVDVVSGHYFVQLRTSKGTNVTRVYISNKE